MPTSNVLAISGTVLFREKLAMPPGGVATVKLVDSTGEVLAATSVDAENGPTEFTLHADPSDVADPAVGAPPASAASGGLLIWARLRSDAGVWGTTELVPVADPTTEVVVTRVDA